MNTYQKTTTQLQGELAELQAEIARLQAIEVHYQELKQQLNHNGAAKVASKTMIGDVAAKLDTVTEISIIIAAIPERDKLLETVVDLIQEKFDLDEVLIYLFDPGDDTLTIAAGAGQTGQALVWQGWNISYSDDHSPVARAARLRSAVVINDVQAGQQWPSPPQLSGTRAEMALPLIFGETLLGVLDLHAAQLDQFTAEDLGINTILARQVAVALQNTTQYQRMQIALANLTRRDQLLSTLSKMGVDLMQRGPEAIQGALARLGEAGEVSRVYIFENFVDDAGALCMRQTHEWVANGIEPQINNPALQHLPYDTVVPRWRDVLSKGDKVVGLVRDFPGSERAILEPQSIRSILVLPMFIEDKFYGFMGFDDCVSDRSWKALEVEVLQTATIFIVNAIVNQQLLAQAQLQADRAQAALADQQETAYLLAERVKELNCLNDIGRAISESPAIPELLQWITARIPPAMRYPELCAVAIEYDQQLYGEPGALEMPAKFVNALRVMGEVVGRIHIAYAEPRDFLDEESALLGGIAGRIGGYIESQRFSEQTQAALAEVRQSQQFLRTIIDNIPTPVFYKDTRGAYLGFNRAFLEFTGKTEDELLHKTVYDLDVPKEKANQFHEADMALLRNPGVQVYETTVTRADGALRDIIFNKATFTRADGQVAGLVGAMVDITARKATEAERERLLAEVEAAYRQYVSQAWDQLLEDKYHGRWHIEVEQPDLTGDQPDLAKDQVTRLETAIELRGQEIGRLRLEDLDPNRTWTADEAALVEAVSAQLAQTIENLRLFGETRQRATREQLTRQIADKMRASPDIDSIIQVGVQELAKVLTGSHVVVELDVPAE